MEFVYPRYLWLLLGVPVLMILWGIGIWHQRRMRNSFGDLQNLEEISRISWGGRGWLRGGLFASSMAAMIVALAYPQMVIRERRAIPMPTDVIFLLDISPSMFAKDMDPNRLGRAEQLIQQFILHKLPDDRYALGAFNVNSVVLSYLTRDPNSLLLYFDYLNQTTEPAIGTNMGAALLSGLRIVDADEQVNPQYAKSRRRVLVLISDGDDNIGEWPGPLAEAARRGIKVYTFGLGTATGAFFPLEMARTGEVVTYATTAGGVRIRSRAQSRTLREVADRTGGRFFRGEDDLQVRAAMDEILATGRPIAGYEDNPIRRDLSFYFLAAAFILMIGGAFF